MKKPTFKSLLKKAERLSKKICELRDGACQVHKKFPNIGIGCNGYLQADHGITRACKKYFLDTRNLTWVCGSANRAKHFKNKSVDEAIRQIVIEREGQEFWDEMVAWNMSKEPFKEWGKIWWIQEEIDKLTDQLAGIELTLPLKSKLVASESLNANRENGGGE